MSGFKLFDPAAKINKIANKAINKADEPLTLTVHSLPSAVSAPKMKSSGRWKMLALMLACAAPVVLSYLTYYVIRPEGRKNYGQLISPTRVLPNMDVQRLDGSTVNLQSLKGQWLIVSVGDAACDAACEKRIYWQRQLREVTGRDKDRIERVWLVNDAAPVKSELAKQVHAPLNDAQAFRVPKELLQTWLALDANSVIEEHLYVVDPMGQLMLRWPAAIDAAKAKRDMHNLLRASGSWDQAGRQAVKKE